LFFAGIQPEYLPVHRNSITHIELEAVPAQSRVFNRKYREAKFINSLNKLMLFFYKTYNFLNSCKSYNKLTTWS
jgi:hypothetical protein